MLPNRALIRNEQGVSLVEVMIALLVLLLVFIGLMQAALLGIDSNMRNILRDEGIATATSVMEEERNALFTQLRSDTGAIPSGADCPAAFTIGSVVQRDVRSITGKDFCVTVNCMERGGDNDCTTDDADTKQMTVFVGWRWKGEDYTHTVSTLRRR
ncbi:MAG: type IV pilus modification PilV family protein [Nitrospirota bacterium]